MPRQLTHRPTALRTHRRRHGFTQRQVALLLGCRAGSKASRYERGVRVPTLETILAYELVFGVPARDLFPEVFAAIQAGLTDRVRALYQELDAAPVTPQVQQQLSGLWDALVRMGASLRPMV